MQLKIYPNKCLEVVCKPLEKVLPKHITQAAKMHSIMLKNNGVGLSAPQVGLSTQIIVINTMKVIDKGVRLTMFNPKIISTTGEPTIMKEGCLSFPDLYIDVKRYEKIAVEYLDATNLKQVKVLDGLTAQAVQHEIDHLHGILYTTKEEKKDA